MSRYSPKANKRHRVTAVELDGGRSHAGDVCDVRVVLCFSSSCSKVYSRGVVQSE